MFSFARGTEAPVLFSGHGRIGGPLTQRGPTSQGIGDYWMSWYTPKPVLPVSGEHHCPMEMLGRGQGSLQQPCSPSCILRSYLTAPS